MRLKVCFVLLSLLLLACSQPVQQSAAPAVPTAVQESATGPITPQELAAQLQQPDRPFLLDVREPFETEISSIPGTSALIPLGELDTRLNQLDPNQEIVIYCRSGNRSQQAVNILQSAGFSHVRNLEGGINEWTRTIDPSMPTY